MENTIKILSLRISLTNKLIIKGCSIYKQPFLIKKLKKNSIKHLHRKLALHGWKCQVRDAGLPP